MTQVLHVSTTRHEEWGGRPRYMRIVVHDTLEELRAAAAAYRGDGFDPGRAAGLFQYTLREHRLDASTPWVNVNPPSWLGVMRVCRTRLIHEVIAHECVHAAAAIMRMDVRTNVVLGRGIGDREEQLAYAAGDLTAGCIRALRNAGLEVLA